MDWQKKLSLAALDRGTRASFYLQWPIHEQVEYGTDSSFSSAARAGSGHGGKLLSTAPIPRAGKYQHESPGLGASRGIKARCLHVATRLIL